MPTRRNIAVILLTLAALVAGPAAWAQDSEWSVQAFARSGFFRVYHDASSKAGTVRYRTVSQSAIAGVHFTNMYSDLHFNAGEEHKDIPIELIKNTADPRYYFHLEGSSHSFRVELLDPEELNVLASADMVLDDLQNSDENFY